MKKVIDGKMYNTETATLLGKWSNNLSYSDFSHCEQSLYRTLDGGAYFVYGVGGPLSYYARSAGQNQWVGGQDIELINLATAKQWAEDCLDAEDYIKVFGQPTEG